VFVLGDDSQPASLYYHYFLRQRDTQHNDTQHNCR
jgi:hypothetical protein